MTEEERQASFPFVAEDPLRALADAMGIAAAWTDIEGREHQTTAETRIALLAAMGMEADTPARAADRLAELQARRAGRRLPDEIVLQAGRLLEPAPRGDWRLELEDGAVLEGAPRLSPPPGVHRMVCGEEVCPVIVAPARAPSAADVTGRPRLWGFAAPLWGLNGPEGAGVGDYGDLADAAGALGRVGADFVGINPVHARGAAHEGISPYSPSSRIAYATAHVAPRRLPGFAACPAAVALAEDAAEAAARARAGALAQWNAHAAIVTPVLRALYDATAGTDPDFAAWLAGPGAALRDFAAFEALSLRYGEDWRRWPDAVAQPHAPGVARFLEADPDAPRWRLWLQYAADRQLGEAQAAARAAGMGLGLYLDLAVGVRPDGADVWRAPDAYARGVSLGAPPDRLAPHGQSWGLAPFSPEGLRARAYAPFRETLRAAMRHAGMVRIDHVLGFMRAYWAPEDGAPGGYVRYPFEALMAITRLEASRAGCLVIGEDLGTVPEGFRDRLAASGLYGCAVMQFEQDRAGFTPPHRWRPGVAASFGTHDTPTVRGWLRGRDIDWRERAGDYDAATADAARDARARDRAALARMLRGSGHAADSEADTVAAVHAALAESPAALAVVSLDDATGSPEQQNLPGDTHAHPNWRRRLGPAPGALDGDAGVARAAATMRARRPR